MRISVSLIFPHQSSPTSLLFKDRKSEARDKKLMIYMPCPSIGINCFEQVRKWIFSSETILVLTLLEETNKQSLHIHLIFKTFDMADIIKLTFDKAVLLFFQFFLIFRKLFWSCIVNLWVVCPVDWTALPDIFTIFTVRCFSKMPVFVTLTKFKIWQRWQ